jgi:amino acid adenylation domain-containing protein
MNPRSVSPSKTCVLDLYEEIVERLPDNTAVFFEEQSLSYRELNMLSNQLAHHLRTIGVGPETLVGMCFDRSLEMVIAILGILKAGGAYVPLDPAYPKERLAFILKDSKPLALLTQSYVMDEFSTRGMQIVSLDRDRSVISRYDSHNPPRTVKEEHLAYVTYTSGHTGKPKGVMITHGNLVHYVRSMRVPIGITSNDRYLHMASISSSSSVRELMVPLSQGATVVVANTKQIGDPLTLFEMIKRNTVTIMDIVPSYLRNCIQALGVMELGSRARLLENQLRLILSTSEPLLCDLPREWLNTLQHKARLVNMFGYSETTGVVATYPIPTTIKGIEKVVPVGKPIRKTRIHLLDSHLCRVPLGEPGEIYIGGPGVGKGYLNEPELTKERFVCASSGPEPGGRLYRTGDMGRCLPDGNIELLGGKDRQEKIHGRLAEPREAFISAYMRCEMANENAVEQLGQNPA